MRRAESGRHRSQSFDEIVDVGMPSGVSDFERVAKGELLQIVREVLRARHRSVLQEYRQDRNVALEGDPDLLAHEILRVVQPAPSGRILGVEPTRADKRQKRATRLDALPERYTEISSRSNAVDVNKYRLLTKDLLKLGAESSCLSLRVPAPIADEDADHRLLPVIFECRKTRSQSQGSFHTLSWRTTSDAPHLRHRCSVRPR